MTSEGALKTTVVLVGMMGCGKSAIGRALSTRLGVAFRDSDAEIEAAAQMSIADIFARFDEPYFRAREAEIIARLLGEAPGVLSTGGGAWLEATNRAAIRARGVSVWLDADLELLWERVRHKDTRPLLQTPDPRATLARLFAERTPIYARAAIRVETRPGFSIDETTDAVMAALSHAGHLTKGAA